MTKTMKRVWLVTVLALLSVGLSKASDVTETNAMPADFRNLMKTQGYAINQPTFGIPPHNKKSQAKIPLAERTRSILFTKPEKTVGWNLWNNSRIRRVGRIEEPMNLSSSPLTRYEYDITYSFAF